MPLTAIQKSQIRRHLKYENVGFAASSPQGGGGTLGTNESYQATSYYGKLEIKMNSLQPCDEATLVGKAYASFNILGFPPNQGDEAILTFANLAGASGPLPSSPYSITVACNEESAGDQGLFALQIALAISKDTTLASTGFQALAPYGPGSEVLNPMTEIGITNQQTFSLASSVSGGAAFSCGVMDNGNVLPDPAVQVGSSAGIPIIVNGYLPLLNYLYGAIGTATTRQGTLQADVFKARQDEVPARKKLYEFYQHDLASFLAVPLNPLAAGGKRSYGQIVM